MIKKKICFCRDTDTQVDILNAKQVWVPTKYSYDRYAKRMLPIDVKMIGYADRKVLHEVNPQIAPSWEEIEKGDSRTIVDDTHTGVIDKELNTIQEFFSSKEQLLKAIEKNAVKRPIKNIEDIKCEWCGSIKKVSTGLCSKCCRFPSYGGIKRPNETLTTIDKYGK